MSKEDWILDYVQRLSVRSGDGREGFAELLWRSHAYKAKFNRKRGRNRFEFFGSLGVEWVVWVPEDCGSNQLGVYFFQQLQPLG
jgi:hypothetical protein